MRILVVGSGGREHALVWKIAQSTKAVEIYAAPGNAGTAALAHNLNISPTDIPALGEVARDRKIDLAVIGPEQPLSMGVVDHFATLGIPVFGPTRAAARIETSKAFAKDLLQRHGIPCAASATFSDFSQARSYLEKQNMPVVVKADGLAAGKGSIITSSHEEAVNALHQIMQDRIFGAAGDLVVIEEYLTGKEVSLVAVADGATVVPLLPACDYKKAGDNDTGLNTGGMGAYCPPGFFARADIGRATRAILEPTVRALAAEGTVFRGVLYAGLMVSPDGVRTLEFNARFGDPETQVTLPLLKSDIVDVFLAAVEGRLDKLRIDWYDSACVGVVMASAGYPGDYRTGFPIAGLDNLDRDVLAFHAGTRIGADGKSVLTGGGRVLNVVAIGKTLAEAREKAYKNVERISFDGAYYRRDIAAREVC